MRYLHRFMQSIVCVLLAQLYCQAASAPNFVVILLDDMPWSGTSVRMDPSIPASAMAHLHMPNVEQMTARGMVFRNARSAAGMCAPSRCSLMTGMMSAQHLYSGNGGFGSKTDGTVEYMSRKVDKTYPLLQPEPQGNIRFPSIGDVLHKVGYATAHFGKWHLYGGGPQAHGFDESDGETDNKNGSEKAPDGKRLDTIADPKHMFAITNSAMSFITKQSKADKPFYVQLSHYAMHGGYQTRPATFEKYDKLAVFNAIENKNERKNAVLYAAMAEDVDDSIGQLLKSLDDNGVRDNTYIIFTSDNGYHTWNALESTLRGEKWWLWDGGLRVPFIMTGPGIAAGSHTPVNIIGYDILPTLADLAKAKGAVPATVDGVSFKPALFNQPIDDAYRNRPLYFHYPHYRVSSPCSVIITGDTKLMHWYELPNERFLYDMKIDIGEKTNIAAQHREQTELLYQTMMTKFDQVGAYFPKTNPDVPPSKISYDPRNINAPLELAGEKDGKED